MITGANRTKNFDEIVSQENVITESGWVKITVHGVEELQIVLGSLPESEQIFWLDGKLVEPSNDTNFIRFPPKAIIEQVLHYSRQQGLNLQIDQ